MEKVKFVGIDRWNRPIFKSLDRRRRFYGCTYKLFSYASTEKEVLESVTEDDITYFGTSFGCEPMGTFESELEIVRS